MENKELKIKEEYLEEVIGYVSRCLVGKILKRYEILEDKNVLKQEIKELIYEELRHCRDLILASNQGLNISVFKFNKRREE